VASSKLLDFLIRTANEPEVAEDILSRGQDRATFIKILRTEHGLSDEQAGAVADEDMPAIGRHIAAELVGGTDKLRANELSGLPPINITAVTSQGCTLHGMKMLHSDDK
jgi:hypothetical protein